MARTDKTELVDNWCWSFASDEDRRYHDEEWGIPVHDERAMFEHLSLECLQFGLTWAPPTSMRISRPAASSATTTCAARATIT